MTLTGRLNLFFLAALALVLAGFSATVYGLASVHMYGQADERLESALNTLGAAAEVGRDSVEWEPSERSLRVGPRQVGDQPVWGVTDEAGRPVDRSPQPEAEDILGEAASHLREAPDDVRRVRWQGGRWQAGQRWLRPDPSAALEPNPGDATAKRHAALLITAAVPLEPIRATLRQLAAALAGTSAAVLFVAALLGRAVCRRALSPLRRMAEAARAMGPADAEGRLAVPLADDELADLGQSFNGLLDRLRESHERQRRFTGDASHQLRTPLTVILGQVEVALRRDRPADEYRRTLETVHARAGHLQRIVDALLFLARADGEAASPVREQLNLSTWLPRHLESWAGHPRRGDLRAEVNGEPAEVQAHPVLLGELVNVLLDNACRYSRPGTPVTAGVACENGDVWVEIADEGPGINEADLVRIFEPFVSLAGGGVGLGLSIARRLAEVMGGSLSASSAPGRGSRFRLTLPAAGRHRGGDVTAADGNELTARAVGTAQ
jgi:signal transduction histidine kinase